MLRIIALTAAAVLMGCGGGEPDLPSEVIVTDSLGIRVVENRGPTRVLTIRESLRFGLIEGDPDLLFDRVRAVAWDADGSIWVADSHESVRRYTRKGAFLGSVGGAGTGPGESPGGYGDLWLADSTLYVLSFTPALQRFERDGTFLDSRMPFTDSGALLLPLGPAGEDWLFSRRDVPSGNSPGTRSSWTVMRGPATAIDEDSLVTFAGIPMIQGPSPNSWGYGSFFDGFPSLTSDGIGSIYYSDATDYRITVFGGDGRLRSLIRRAVPRIPYDERISAAIERGLESAWISIGNRPGASGRRRMLEAALPDTEPTWLPAIDLVLAARDGTLWVRRADQYADPALRAVAQAFGLVPHAWLDEWRSESVFDLIAPDGSYRGTVKLPFAFSPMAVTQSEVIGTIRDEFEVEYITAFEVGGAS